MRPLRHRHLQLHPRPVHQYQPPQQQLRYPHPYPYSHLLVCGRRRCRRLQQLLLPADKPQALARLLLCTCRQAQQLLLLLPAGKPQAPARFPLLCRQSQQPCDDWSPWQR